MKELNGTIMPLLSLYGVSLIHAAGINTMTKVNYVSVSETSIEGSQSRNSNRSRDRNNMGKLLTGFLNLLTYTIQV